MVLCQDQRWSACLSGELRLRNTHTQYWSHVVFVRTLRITKYNKAPKTKNLIPTSRSLSVEDRIMVFAVHRTLIRKSRPNRCNRRLPSIPSRSCRERPRNRIRTPKLLASAHRRCSAPVQDRRVRPMANSQPVCHHGVAVSTQVATQTTHVA